MENSRNFSEVYFIMPITNLARQRRHLVNLNTAKQWLDKWAKVHSRNREDLEISEIIPYVDTKLWNVFLIRCNFVDDMLVYAMRDAGFRIIDITPKSIGFEVRVMEDPDPVTKWNLVGSVRKMETDLRSEKLTIAIERYLKEGHW